MLKVDYMCHKWPTKRAKDMTKFLDDSDEISSLSFVFCKIQNKAVSLIWDFTEHKKSTLNFSDAFKSFKMVKNK